MKKLYSLLLQLLVLVPWKFSEFPKIHMRGILNSQDGDMDCYLYNKGKDDPLKADLKQILHIFITMKQGRPC